MVKIFFGTIILLGIIFDSFFFTRKRENEIKPAQFNHIALYVYDLQKSADFYQSVFHFQKIEEPFKDGKHIWFKIGDHSQLHLISGNTKEQSHIKDNHLAFSVPDFSEMIRQLDSVKINYTNWQGTGKEPTLRSDKVKQVYLQDPDGNWVEINDDRF